MRNFIFLTMQGFTYDPNNKEIQNMQVLGSATGGNIQEALKSFRYHQSYLNQFAFKDVISLEYIGDFIHHLEL